ncbi:VOC family protein [Sinomonas sp. JGH33]|uniref:VOC family protein n=1 Tax=Sinomonas terricola TaxID=3110330 RepID=A0ABU5TC41_9MICC|nr:VOC family protein [Sinomonas sp. JGH33]MEA5457225.1 VOC family protein [Sinomonas sp. JGH33]
MFEISGSFSSFSVDDVEKARDFYAGTLGFQAADALGGGLDLTLPGGGRVYAYPKSDHVPATHTVLNLVVPDIEAAVASLHELGIRTDHYPSTPEMPLDENGILRDPNAPEGFGMAWFKDPAGNVISVLAQP